MACWVFCNKRMAMPRVLLQRGRKDATAPPRGWGVDDILDVPLGQVRVVVVFYVPQGAPGASGAGGIPAAPSGVGWVALPTPIWPPSPHVGAQHGRLEWKGGGYCAVHAIPGTSWHGACCGVAPAFRLLQLQAGSECGQSGSGTTTRHQLNVGVWWSDVIFLVHRRQCAARLRSTPLTCLVRGRPCRLTRTRRLGHQCLPPHSD